MNAIASADNLSPATLSARNHLTSELLRTLSRVAASKPTSWLSEQSNIVSHLAKLRDLSWRSGLFPFRPMKLIPHGLTAGLWSIGIRSLIGVGKLVGPLTHSVLYLQR